MEKSPAVFRSTDAYIHRRETSYDSGISLPETAMITCISLDSFREEVQNITCELDAWLTFLVKTDIESILNLVNSYPEFAPIYQEIGQFRKDPKGMEDIMCMITDALWEMDRNTEQYMVEELQEEVAAEKKRADSEALRADKAEARADSETLRADSAEARIKELEAIIAAKNTQ